MTKDELAQRYFFFFFRDGNMYTFSVSTDDGKNFKMNVFSVKKTWEDAEKTALDRLRQERAKNPKLKRLTTKPYKVKI